MQNENDRDSNYINQSNYTNKYKSSFGLGLRTMALVLVATFSLQQIGFAADDIFRVNKQRTDQRFAPDYIKKRAAQKNALIDQKGFLEGIDQDSTLDKNLRKGKKGFIDDDRREGNIRGGPGRPPAWELVDFNELGEPTGLIVNTYDDDGNLLYRSYYDLTGEDASRWLSEGEEQENDDGEKFFVGYSNIDADGLTLLSRTHFKEIGGKRVVDFVESNFIDGRAYRVTVYEHDENGIALQAKTYSLEGTDIDPFEDEDFKSKLDDSMLTRLEVFEDDPTEEEEDRVRVKYAYENYADEDGENTPHSFVVYDYDEEGALVKTRRYKISDFINTGQWESVMQDLLDGG